MALSVFGLCFVDPKNSQALLISLLLSLSLFSGCLYIVGLAYELESLDEKFYSMGSASVIAGYRTGLLCAGAVALYLAHLYGWSAMFLSIAGLLLFSACLVLIYPEPYKSKEIIKAKKEQFRRYPSLFHGFCREVLIEPCRNFFQKKDVWMVLLFLFMFKAADHLFKNMEGPFYIHVGFDKQDLAFASKMCGFAATIAGAFITGLFLRNKDPLQSAAVVGIIHSASLIGYWIQASIGKVYAVLYLTSLAGSFTGGMAMTSVIYLLWRVCDKKFAAVQYAFLWSFFSFKADLLACLGGILAASCSWDFFFFLVTIFGLASSSLIWYLVKIPAAQTAKKAKEA